jgi:hypothetical protein
MRSTKVTTTITTAALLAMAGTVPFFMPDGLTVQAQGAPNTFAFKGVLRDFRRTNTNFAVIPSGGNGHYAGNVMEDLSSSGRPEYEGDGFKVASQWKDNEAHPIAPHMYIDPNNALSKKVRVSTVPSAPKKGVVDTYDSSVGPYGGANVGPAPEYEVGAMPDITVPAALSGLPNQGNLDFSGVTTITSDIHCNKLNASGTLEIDGQISILCEGPMMLETHTTISMKPGSNLKMYLMKGGASWNHTTIGDPAKPGRVKIFNMSDAMFMIHNHAEVYAHISCPTPRWRSATTARCSDATWARRSRTRTMATSTLTWQARLPKSAAYPLPTSWELKVSTATVAWCQRLGSPTGIRMCRAPTSRCPSR